MDANGRSYQKSTPKEFRGTNKTNVMRFLFSSRDTDSMTMKHKTRPSRIAGDPDKQILNVIKLIPGMMMMAQTLPPSRVQMSNPLLPLIREMNVWMSVKEEGWEL